MVSMGASSAATPRAASALTNAAASSRGRVTIAFIVAPSCRVYTAVMPVLHRRLVDRRQVEEAGAAAPAQLLAGGGAEHRRLAHGAAARHRQALAAVRPDDERAQAQDAVAAELGQR